MMRTTRHTVLASAFSAIAICLAPTALTAQEGSAKEAAQGPLTVDITTLKAGRVVEAKDPKTKKLIRKTVEREIAWTIEKRRLSTIKAAELRLVQVAQNPANYRPDPTTGRRTIANLQVTPGANVRWSEVVQTVDQCTKAGFKSATFGGVDANFTRPVAIVEPIVNKSDLTVPGAMFCAPDGRSPKLRPTVDVHRDGRIVIAGQCLFEAKQGNAKNLEPLRKELRKLRAQMKQAGEFGGRDDREGTWIDMPILIRIDGETKWSDVVRLLRELTKPEIGFWKHDFAVGEIETQIR